MNVFVLGGDGFCGWPAALKLSSEGHHVTILDNLSRRAIDNRHGYNSLTPISSIEERLAAWLEVSGKVIEFEQIDLVTEYERFCQLLVAEKPDVLVHFAEQRSAPYSMKSPDTKRYTVNNNVNVTHNVLCAITQTGLDIHVVHLGTMGVYGYGVSDMEIPEGYQDVKLIEKSGRETNTQILYPTNPGSVYHMTKCIDQEMFKYYAKNDGLRITDLHQGIVWGVATLKPTWIRV